MVPQIRVPLWYFQILGAAIEVITKRGCPYTNLAVWFVFRRVSCCRISYEKFSVGEPTGPSNGFTDLGFAGWMQKGLGRMEIAG